MTLQQLKYVIEIQKCGSINEAAKRLFISQPSLSNAIKELEIELGIKIFNRTNRGVRLSLDGVEFSAYARQVLEQAELLETRYLGLNKKTQHFAISAQHYAFVVDAFVKLLDENQYDEYEFNLRETKTYDIIEDVKNLHSEIGILYLSKQNKKVMSKIFRDENLKFTSLFHVTPHIFISTNHPLASKEYVTLVDLEHFPCLTFEQGENNSFHFSEELVNTVRHKKIIHVTDRATLFNLLIGLNGYTISTGLLNTDLNGGKGIISIPLNSEEIFEVGWITHKDIQLTQIGKRYLDILKEIIEKRN